MRYLILCTLGLSLLVAPACERANPPDDQHDAGIVRPPDDGGSAMPDARTSRPGAGPLDPDLTIDCITSPTYQATLDVTTGQELARIYPGFVRWTEAKLPSAAWLCRVVPQDIPNCYYGGNCEVRGGSSAQQICLQAIWNISPDGQYYVQCNGDYQTDYDRDGVFENPFPDIYTAQYLAIIR
jgi:hypothetical protein